MVYWDNMRVDNPNRAHNDLILPLVNVSCGMGQIMNRYDFLEAR